MRRPEESASCVLGDAGGGARGEGWGRYHVPSRATVGWVCTGRGLQVRECRKRITPQIASRAQDHTVSVKTQKSNQKREITPHTPHRKKMIAPTTPVPATRHTSLTRPTDASWASLSARPTHTTHLAHARHFTLATCLDTYFHRPIYSALSRTEQQAPLLRFGFGVSF